MLLRPSRQAASNCRPASVPHRLLGQRHHFRRHFVGVGHELRQLVELQIKGGIDGLVPVGTTGESPTVDNAEHLEVIRTTVEAARGRVPVIAGTGSNSTKEACDMTRAADKEGGPGRVEFSWCDHDSGRVPADHRG